MITPLLNTLNKQGGTLYTFTSASKDLSKVMSDSDITFGFSKFVCLNIPDIYSGPMPEIGTGQKRKTKNKFYIEELMPHDVESYSQDNMNKYLAEHLQDYMFNFEVARLNGEGDDADYVSDYLPTVSEPIFFDWLTKVGAIDLRELTDSKKYVSSGLIGASDVKYFYEYDKHEADETDGKTNDDRVVRYIGDIDIVNQVDIQGDSYTELYLHIPSECGCTPKVIFKNNPNHKNIKANTEYKVTHQDIETEDGCIIGRTKLDGENKIPTTAFYDENGSGDYDYLYKPKEIYNIDFDETDYYDITSNTDDVINTIADYNGSSTADNFEFNAILLYYTLTNKSTRESATNLYGIIFIDNVSDIASNLTDVTDGEIQGYIQRYPKYKKVAQFGVNGNAFGLKVNLKIDTTPTTTGTTSIINDDTTLTGLNMFCDALNELQKATTNFKNQSEQITQLFNDVEYLSNIVIDIPRYTDLVSNVELLQQKIDAQYSFIEGYGISIDRSDNDITFSNPTAVYAVTKQDVAIINDETPYDIALKEGQNVVYFNILNQTENGKLVINMTYKTAEWINGQSVKFMFDKEFTNLTTLSVKDADGTIVNNLTINASTKNTFEVICIDVDSRIFKLIV